MRGSRFVLAQAVKSFLREFTNPADYAFEYSTKEQKISEKKIEQDQSPLSLEELRQLVNEASTRDKAVILVQVSAG